MAKWAALTKGYRPIDIVAVPNSGPPLRVVALSKRYRLDKGGEFEAVTGAAFDVAARECFGLLGPNGAGKSTIIQCICGFYPPSAGHVLIGGTDVEARPKRARQILGVCNQEDTLDSDFNVLDQLIRHATYFRIDARKARARADMLLDVSASPTRPTSRSKACRAACGGAFRSRAL